MTTPGERHVHSRAPNAEDASAVIEQSLTPKAGLRASSVSHSMATADHGVHRLHWIVVTRRRDWISIRGDARCARPQRARERGRDRAAARLLGYGAARGADRS